jgi:hypothetical protein
MPRPEAVVREAPKWRIMARRLTPLAGAVTCTALCAGVPVLVATLSAAGMGFLRTDWLLIPIDVLSVAFVVRGFIRARVRHGRNGPLLLAVAGLVALLAGLRLGDSMRGAWLAVGIGTLLAATVWDQRGRKLTTPL